MRYYDIALTQKPGGAPLVRQSGPLAGQPYHWTSHPNGLMQPPDPGALNVSIDIFSNWLAPGSPTTATPNMHDIRSFVAIEGIPLQDIGQAASLQNAYIRVQGGMGKGLPLANPSQAGELVEGYVYAPFGNWINTEMDLNMRIAFGTAGPYATSPARAVLKWPAFTPLSTVIAQALNLALPGFKQEISISPNLVTSKPDALLSNDLAQLASWLRSVSTDILGQIYNPNTGASYSGVDMAILPGRIVRVTDGTTEQTPKQIAFTDLIGQPLWSGGEGAQSGAPIIQAACVMRSDIALGDFVELPPSLVTATPNAATAAISPYANYRQGSIFQGTFRVTQVHHVGNLRGTDANDWVTYLDMYATQGFANPATSSAASGA